MTSLSRSRLQVDRMRAAICILVISACGGDSFVRDGAHDDARDSGHHTDASPDVPHSRPDADAAANVPDSGAYTDSASDATAAPCVGGLPPNTVCQTVLSAPSYPCPDPQDPSSCAPSTILNCTDVGTYPICKDGLWKCPRGTTPIDRCACPSAPVAGCVCTTRGWECGSLDGGSRDT